jgi:hypothetical protein
MTKPVLVSAIARLSPDYMVPVELARELRRADVFIQMAVSSAFVAVAGLSGAVVPEETGVFVGTAFGPLETNFASLGSLIDDGEGQISPTLFSHSVYNAAAGYVARLLDIRGPVMTITNYGWPFLLALEEARLAVASGRIVRALVIGVETYGELLADAYRRFFQVAAVPWERKAVAWVLEAPGAGKGFCYLQGINIREHDADPADFLTRRGERLTGGTASQELPPHPLAYVEALSEAVREYGQGGGGQDYWLLQAPFGLAEINLAGHDG